MNTPNLLRTLYVQENAVNNGIVHGTVNYTVFVYGRGAVELWQRTHQGGTTAGIDVHYLAEPTDTEPYNHLDHCRWLDGQPCWVDGTFLDQWEAAGLFDEGSEAAQRRRLFIDEWAADRLSDPEPEPERHLLAGLDRQNLEALADLAPRMQAALDRLLGQEQK